MRVNKKLERKVKIQVNEGYITVTNLLNRPIENCLLDVKNILYGSVVYQTFNLEPNGSINFHFLTDNFYEEWKSEKLHVKLYSNHRLIVDRYYNDKSKCFVVLTNDKFESLVEQLIIGLSNYTDIDILHYSIGYKSKLEYPNLTNIEFGIGEDTNDAHYMQFSKAPVFLDVLERGYKNAIFLDADIQVRPNISDMVSLINEIEDGPIFQKGAHDYTIVGNHYIPGPMVQDFLDLPKQKYPHGITNVVIFAQKHKDLIKQWYDICFSDKIKEIKKSEFLHDELLLNCLMWKNNIKPKYYWFGLNVEDLNDVKFFYNYNNQDLIDRLDMNTFDLGHKYQSFIPFDKNEIMFFHCVKDPILAESINKYVEKREISNFEDRLKYFYKDIKSSKKIIENNKLVIIDHNIDGGLIEINADPSRQFKAKFFDQEEILKHESDISGNMWTKTSIQYFVPWRKTIEENGVVIYDQKFNLEGKKAFICLESNSIGDTLAWVPYADEFRKKHNCRVSLCTFHNYLFINQYPDIEFIEPGEVVNGISAQYRIGWYYTEDYQFNLLKHPGDFREQPMQKTATDILGLEYKEVKPKLNIPNVEKKKKVGIAIHGTAQSKYWNNPNGWQEVVDYLKELGYEVMLYSREDDGYMGNNHPKGISKFKGGSLQDVIDDLSTCEFFIGIGSGLSWLAWATNLPIILISGFSESYTETVSNTYRVINKNVCTGCFNWERLDPGDWNWCPKFKGTNRHFECSKEITSDMVIEKIKILGSK